MDSLVTVGFSRYIVFVLYDFVASLYARPGLPMKAGLVISATVRQSHVRDRWPAAAGAPFPSLKPAA